MIRLVKIRIPLYYTVIACAAVAVAMYFYIQPVPQLNADENINNAITPPALQFDVKRLNGYAYIKPLLFVETSAKAQHYAAMTQQVADYVEAKKLSGDIDAASFYFRDLDRVEWTGYNEEEKYNPGSLMKVPELISILRLEEEKPGTLNKQVYYTTPFVTEKRTRFVSKQLKAGKSYTIKDLLHYMISYSDNNATILLDQNLDPRIFNKTLSDLGLPLPKKDSVNYPISAKEISLFIRAIFNATYLTIAHSEYAAELLSTSDFREGFAKGFPQGVKMIHKFGEAGTMEEPQLHESCIVYLNNKPYVLTVMTKGKNISKLADVLADVAAIVYRQLSV